MKKQIILSVSFLGIATFSSAQGHWRLGGNPGTPPPIPDAVTPANNTLGTLNNLPINFATNGSQKGQWTVSTGIPAGLFGAAGDGLRIYPNTPGSFQNAFRLYGGFLFLGQWPCGYPAGQSTMLNRT